MNAIFYEILILIKSKNINVFFFQIIIDQTNHNYIFFFEDKMKFSQNAKNPIKHKECLTMILK